MKVTLIGLLMTVSSIAMAGNRTIFPTTDLAADGSRVEKKLIVSEVKFNSRIEAKSYCESIQAELSPLVNILVSSMEPDGMNTKEAKKYVMFNLTKKITNLDEDITGVMGWADEKTHSEGKTIDGKKPELVLIFNGKNGVEDKMTIEDVNNILKNTNDRELKINAICIK